MANFASLRGPVGMNRVYVKSGAPLEHRRWLSALKAGRSFATNGPLLEMTVDGTELGGEVRLPGRRRRGRGQRPAAVQRAGGPPGAGAEWAGRAGDTAGRPIAGRPPPRCGVPVDRSGWLLLRARGDKAAYPMLDIYPYATTSPVYLTVGGQPARSPEDARYFMAWIDRMRASVEAHRDWNTDAERQETLDMLAQARAEYERRSRE